MHFKWDSSVARDIVTELNRLEENLNDCVSEVEQCAEILRQMQGGELSEAIERYISAAGKAKASLIELEESFQGTGKGLMRANELFEDNERTLQSLAEGMGNGNGMPPSAAGDAGSTETPPLFFDIPALSGFAPVGIAASMPGTPWPALQEVRQTVVIDQVSLSNSVIMPVWLQDIIDADDMNKDRN